MSRLTTDFEGTNRWERVLDTEGGNYTRDSPVSRLDGTSTDIGTYTVPRTVYIIHEQLVSDLLTYLFTYLLNREELDRDSCGYNPARGPVIKNRWRGVEMSSMEIVQRVEEGREFSTFAQTVTEVGTGLREGRKGVP